MLLAAFALMRANIAAFNLGEFSRAYGWGQIRAKITIRKEKKEKEKKDRVVQLRPYSWDIVQPCVRETLTCTLVSFVIHFQVRTTGNQGRVVRYLSNKV